MSFKNRLTSLLSKAEDKWDELVFDFRRRLQLNDPLQIVTYRSYGTPQRLYVKGRVIEDKNIKTSSQKDSVWKNALAMYRRFESDEVPGAKLKISFQEQHYFVITDKEGYFILDVVLSIPIEPNVMWFRVAIELVEAPLQYTPPIQAYAEVLVPPADAEYGIISDIDDTIVKTGATDLLAMSRNTFLHNAHTRLPFAGVAEFYKSLLLGRNGKRNNPFFYVSSSPWNLYELLRDFMDLNNIPEGPLLLRDFGLEANKVGSTGHMGHKFKEIKHVMDTYPNLRFILIGDSGQEDPIIYKRVAEEFPGRVLAIYIRDVQLKDREKIALEISSSLQDVEMIVVDNTVEAAEHAAKTGLIFTDAIPEIVKDKQQDKGETEGKEDLRVFSEDAG